MSDFNKYLNKIYGKQVLNKKFKTKKKSINENLENNDFITKFISFNRTWIPDRNGILQAECYACKGKFIEAFSSDEMTEYKYCPHCGRESINSAD